MLRGSSRLHQERGHVLQTPPAEEPVSADELREYSVATSEMLPNAAALDYIATARSWIEEQTGLAMVSQVWLMTLDRWPNGREPWWDGVREMAISELAGAHRTVDLPRYPLMDVTGVSVYDTGGNSSAVTIADVFDIDTYRKPGRLALKTGASWPVALRDTNAIEIRYTAGYGDAEDVPVLLAYAVKSFAGYLFDRRGACSMAQAYSQSGAKSAAEMFAVANI